MRKNVVTKYRRKRTIVKKMLELAKLRNLKINMIIYDPKRHKIEQVFTDDDFSISNINQMMLELNDVPVTQKARRKQLKFESRNAKTSFKFTDKELQDINYDDDADSMESESLSDAFIEEQQELQSVKQHSKESMKSMKKLTRMLTVPVMRPSLAEDTTQMMTQNKH